MRLTLWESKETQCVIPSVKKCTYQPVRGLFIIPSPSDFRMREISFLRFSQDHLPWVWSQANLSAWKTETVWAKESLYFGNESTGFGKQAAPVADYPGCTFPVSTPQHSAHPCQLAPNSGARIRHEQGPQPFPFAWTSKNHRKSQSWERSQ